jgi:hypothetical protein
VRQSRPATLALPYLLSLRGVLSFDPKTTAARVRVLEHACAAARRVGD